MDSQLVAGRWVGDGTVVAHPLQDLPSLAASLVEDAPMGERTLTAARLPDSAGGCGRKAANQRLIKS